MQLAQRLRRLVNRVRRRLVGAGADHEPVVEIVGFEAPRARRPRRKRLLEGPGRAAAGFLVTLTLAGLAYAWLAAEDARAPPPFAERAAEAKADDALAAALVVLEEARAPATEPILILSRRGERERLGRLGAVRAVGAAAGALSELAGAASASALAPAAALKTDPTLAPARLRTAADALTRADLDHLGRDARISALAREAARQMSEAATELRAQAPQGVFLPRAQERAIVEVRACADAWAAILAAETRHAAAPARASLEALARVASFRPAVFLAGPSIDHAAIMAAHLDAAASDLGKLSEASSPATLRGLAR